MAAEAAWASLVSESSQGDGRVGGDRISAWAAAWRDKVSNAELSQAWDAADVGRRGSLDRDEFTVFWSALDAAAVRHDEAKKKSFRWDGRCSAALLGLLAACLREDDAEGGLWNASAVASWAKCFGLGRHAPACVAGVAASDPMRKRRWPRVLEKLYLKRSRGVVVRAELARRVLEACPDRSVLLQQILRRVVVGPTVALGGTYDARRRRAVAKALAALGYPNEIWLCAAERGFASAIREQQAGAVARAAAAQNNKTVAEKLREAHRSSRVGRYAAIGGAAIASGAIVAMTAGAAAPMLVAAMATSTVWGASTLILIASYTSVFAATFGAAGAGLAGYKMGRRVKGLTDFEFVSTNNKAAMMTVVVAVAGSMRDKSDFASAYGCSLPPDAPIERRLCRLLAQRGASQEDARRRAYELLKEARAAARGEAALEEQEPNKNMLWLKKNFEGLTASSKSGSSEKERVEALVADYLGVDYVDATEPTAERPLDAALQREALGALSAQVEKKVATTEEENFCANLGADEELVMCTTLRSAMALAREEGEEAEELLLDFSFEEEDDEEQEDAAAKKQTTDDGSPSTTPTARLVEEQPQEEEDGFETSVGGELASPLWWWKEEFGASSGEMHILVWERKLLVEVTSSIAGMAQSMAASGTEKAILVGASTTVLALALTAMIIPLSLLRATNYIDSTWTLAIKRADAAGIALADALCAREQIGARPVTLVGYSLGARVVFKCLQELAKRHDASFGRHKAAGIKQQPLSDDWSGPESDDEDDEEEAEEEERLVGRLHLRVVDGVHWIGGAATELPCIGLLARVGSPRGFDEEAGDKTTPSVMLNRAAGLLNSKGDSLLPKCRLGQPAMSALPGEPIIFDPAHAANTCTIEVDCLKRHATLDLALTAGGKKKKLACARFRRWLGQAAKKQNLKHLRLAPLREMTSSSTEPVASIRLELCWEPTAAAQPPTATDDDGIEVEEKRRFAGIVEHAVLIGMPAKGAPGKQDKKRWRAASRVVAGRLVNCYSTKDLMLGLIFRSNTFVVDVAGLAPVVLPGYVHDLDVSDIVGDHEDYPKKVKDILRRVNLKDPNQDDLVIDGATTTTVNNALVPPAAGPGSSSADHASLPPVPRADLA